MSNVRPQMNSSGVVAIVLLGALLLANVGVSVSILRAHYYNRSQKAAQMTIVWLLPLAGALGVGIFLYSQRDNPMYDTRTYPEPNEKAVAITIHESIQGHEHGQ
jgi:hypothetical protein